MPFDLDRVRSRFPALAITDNGVPRIYLDNPAGTQVPASVAEAMADCLLTSNANLGGYFASSDAAVEVVAESRRAMADLLNAPSVDEIIFGANMTTITLHLSRSIGRLFALAEDYPDLKASEGFRQLHDSLVEIEEQLQFARRYYNGSVRDNNNLVEGFPSLIVARLFRFIPAEFFEIELASQRAAPQVNLGR